jgi:hypothetical protein
MKPSSFMGFAIVSIASFFMMGCTSIQVRPVEPKKDNLKLVYIKENPNSGAGDLLMVIERQFQRHGIETKVISGEPPASTDYLLTYNSQRNWDMSYYLAHADLFLKRGNKLVAEASYNQGGGFNFGKWGSTESKMAPIIDQMLAGVRN